ncbi:hypothetical protein [Spirillospora sp. NPDC047279]|uniref:hypothetical protein n=1 Tax=Spirillospora sp. NPDC047279 TaxID=3155478 RepID=UPI0033C2916F
MDRRRLFRDLYSALIDVREGEEHTVLRAWRAPVAEALEALAPLRRRDSALRSGGEDLWALYALSRVGDFLIELGCPAGDPGPGLGVTGGRRPDHRWLSEHERFFAQVGLQRFEHGAAFSPFHHEIFAVSVDETAGEVTVEDVVWPGFRFGDLLFCRAGVHLRAPSRLIDATVATTSTLYFTFRRTPRGADDPSHGWGSNSQWRTSFPRFYEDSDGLHFNWDGDRSLAGRSAPPDHDPAAGPTLEQRRELLLNRCFVTSPLPADEHDRYPYEDRISLRESRWPLDAADVLPDPPRAG